MQQEQSILWNLYTDSWNRLDTGGPRPVPAGMLRKAGLIAYSRSLVAITNPDPRITLDTASNRVACF